MGRRFSVPFVGLVGLLVTGATSAVAEPLLRFPDIHGDTLVFAQGDDLWSASTAGGPARRLTDFPGTDHLPMWIGETIYFASDRDGRRNLFSFDPATGAIARVTDHRDFDVLRPSEGGERIVYEVGGSLWLLDTSTGRTARVPVELTPDPRDRRPYQTSVAEHLTGVACSPQGGRALLTARGEVFTVPRLHGATRNLTSSPGARERGAVWSPDGRRVAYLSDSSGEVEVWVRDASGDGEPLQLTDLGPGYRHTLRWSPDGSRLALADHTLALLVLDLASREVARVDRAEHEPVDSGLDAKPISDFAWSPDGRWLAYSKIGDDLVSHLHLYSLDQRTVTNVSSGLFNDFGPVWSRDGEHLLFISNRRFDPIFCDFEWEMVYKNVAGLYALTLRRDGPPLLAERSDESALAGEDAGPAPAAERPTPRVVVDLEGLADRVEALPVLAGNYRQLAASPTELLYLDAPSGDFNRFDFRTPPARTLAAYSWSRRTTRTLAEGVDDYDLSVDGCHVAFRKGATVGMLSLEGDSGSPEVETLDLDQVTAVVDPPAEWRQMFLETWRMERDFYYEPSMNGLDWEAVRRRYEPLLDRLACRRDLGFLIGELIGELATSHTYGSGGDELPHLFRAMGLGPVIGTRTWGGLVGVSMSVPLVDGGTITAPDYRVYTPEGQWVVENEGVSPDIEVDLDPAEVARGRDAQLEKGIEVLLERLEKDPITAPQHPPFPRQNASGL